MKWLVAAGLLALSPVAVAQSTSEGKRDQPQRGSAPTPKDRDTSAANSQRGTIGSTAGGEERTSTPGAGIESGTANGLAGGRTDEGPRGGTGIRGFRRRKDERKRANQNAQARGPNAPGSFERPADTPPQINTDPKPMGSGAPEVPVSEEPQARGRNYGRSGGHAGRAGGVASGEGNPGGAAAQGPAGKGAQTQPKDHEKTDANVHDK